MYKRQTIRYTNAKHPQRIYSCKTYNAFGTVSYTHLEPERLTDDDVMLLLKLIFHRQDTQDILKKLLEREKPETP